VASYDVNGDGLVNILDLILVAQHFGESIATIKGVVTDASTGLPIPGVAVVLAGNSVLTDAGGNYTFDNITPGSYIVSFTKTGYQTVTL
jgi:protocatechuate 3,4-dioxygenase beta subunit